MTTSEKMDRDAENHHGVNWREMYHIAGEWRSDLLFFNDEIRFFQDMMSKYFVQLMENLKKTRMLAQTLEELEYQRIELQKKVEEHLGHLAEHFSSPFVLADKAYIDQHELLKADLVRFTKQFRKTKKVLFKHIDFILKSEKHKHLINKL